MQICSDWKKVMTMPWKFIKEAETLSEIGVTVFTHAWEYIFRLFYLFWRNETRLMRLRCCLCVCVITLNQCLNAWTNLYETLYIMAAEPISTVYLINPTHQPLCLYVYSSYRCQVMVQFFSQSTSPIIRGWYNRPVVAAVHKVPPR
jgi:hypothetical protein